MSRINLNLSGLVRGLNSLNKNAAQIGQVGKLFGSATSGVGSQPEKIGSLIGQLGARNNLSVGDSSSSPAGNSKLSEQLSKLSGLREQLASALSQTSVDDQEFESLLRQFSEVSGSLPTRVIQDSSETSTTTVVGQNVDQITDVEVVQIDANTSTTVEGEVTRSAEAATISVTGANGGFVTATGTFQVTGNRGSQSFSIEAGESLSDVASRVNDARFATGVQASADSDELQLTTLDLGSDATVRFKVIDLDAAQTISGVNAGQIESFSTTSAASGTTTLSGQFVSDSQGAELRLIGASGSTIEGTATFDLTGSTATASFAVTEGESLATVADRVNAETSNTGITASVDGNELVFTSTGSGQSASIAVSNVVRDSTTSITGVNGAQVTDVQVGAITANTTRTISGTIDSTATSAELVYQGSSGEVVDDASFDVTGNLGTATISITGGETLSAAADRINAENTTTGVTATVDGDQLRFTTDDSGASATLAVELVDVESQVSTSGVNASQLSNFTVDAIADNSSTTFSGTIDQAAGSAELTRTFGALGNGSNATVEITGSEGTTTISVGTFESAESVRDKINAETANTGVSASVSGTTLTLTSTGVGSAAIIEVNVTSGSFATSGGNGDGTANGQDALATVNGQSLTASGNDFTITDGGSTVSFTAVQGFTGTIDDVTTTAVDGAFNLSGGNGDGTANGTEATATLNGQTLTATAGGVFSVDVDGDTFSLTVDESFTGSLDTITVTSADAEFETVDETSTTATSANGSDAQAIINGETLTSSDRSFSLSDESGTFNFTFDEGFSGTFDTITVTNEVEGELTAVVSTATGIDSEATINGESITGEGNRFTIKNENAEVALTFASGFTGTFEELTIEDATTANEGKDSGEDEDLNSVLGSLLASDASTRQEALEAALAEIVPIENALFAQQTREQELAANSGSNQRRSLLSDFSNDSSELQRAAIFSESFRQLVEENPRLAANSLAGRGLDPQTVLDLLA